MACPTPRIKLTPYAPELVRRKGRDTFRVKVQASDAANMPNEIFGYQRTLLDPHTGEQLDEFCFVCSPFDLVTYPANEPRAGQLPAFFRKSYVDILVPGLQTVQETLDEIEQQVCHLVTTLKTQCEVAALEPYWCPAPPPDAEPDDSSILEDSSSL